jgi:hypothetical protein
MTGWMLTDAVTHAACPRCGQAPGASCRQPSGRQATCTHTERVIAFKATDKFNIDNYRINVSSPLTY